MRAELHIRGFRKTSAKIKEISVNVRGKAAADIVDDAQNYAFSIMPYQYGYLLESLEVVKFERSAQLVQRQPQTPGVQRPYHMWMAGLGQYPQVKNFIKSGDPMYMKETVKYIRKKYPDIIKRNIYK